MNKLKKATLMLGLASMIALSGCKEEQQETNNKEESQETIEYPDIEKLFGPGEHIVEIRFEETFPEDEESVGYVGLPFEVPDGYELFDFEARYYQSSFYHHVGSVYVFRNTKPVKVIGRYEEKFGTYVFPEPGEVIEDKELNLKN